MSQICSTLKITFSTTAFKFNSIVPNSLWQFGAATFRFLWTVQIINCKINCNKYITFCPKYTTRKWLQKTLWSQIPQESTQTLAESCICNSMDYNIVTKMLQYVTICSDVETQITILQYNKLRLVTCVFECITSITRIVVQTFNLTNMFFRY